MQKVKPNNLTAGMLSQNFKETVKSFVANDKAYSFMSAIKGTPAYWKKFFVSSLSNGKATWFTHIFYDLVMCRSEME